MVWLRQNTSGQEIPIGPFLDNTDGDTELTSLTIDAADIQIWKNGASAFVAKNSGGASHMADGVYYATLDEVDTDTLGPMVVYVHVAGALYVRLGCLVLSAEIYDALVAGTDYLQADTVQIKGSDAAASLVTATQIDTELTANHGSGLWSSSNTGNGIHGWTPTVKDADTGMAIQGASVRVANVSNDEVYGPVTTNGDGQCMAGEGVEAFAFAPGQYVAMITYEGKTTTFNFEIDNDGNEVRL